VFKKKVYIVGAFPPGVGGVATYNLLLEKLLIKDSFSVEVVDFSYYNFYNFLKKLFQIKKSSILVDSYRISIESISFKRLPFYLLMIFFKQIKWIRIVHDGTFPEQYNNFSKLKKIFLKISLLFIYKTVCVSEDLKDFFDNNSLGKNKTMIIGSLLPFYKVFNLSKTTKENIIVTSGAFTANYSIKDVLLAYSNLDDSIKKDYRLIILKTSFSQDSDYQDKIDWFIKQKKLNVKIYNNLDYSETLKIFSISKIYVRSVKKESFGLSKVESVILGNQVVTTETGITNYMHTYEHGNYKDLHQKILYCISIDNEDNEARTFYITEAEKNYNLLKELIYD